MEMDLSIWLQLAVVLVCVAVGGRLGGVGLGAAIGIPPLLLVALYPATCGDFLIPGGAQIGCCSFDRTGTTHLGSWVLNHSYLLPGCVHVITGVAAGYAIYCML